MFRLLFLIVPLLACLAADNPASRPAEYFTDFHNAAAGKVPDDLMVLSGEFVVGESGGKKFLEIPGEPLDTFGVLFGPADFVSGDISAMVWGEASGKRFPEFGIGSNDTGGIKLWVFASQNRLELRRRGRCDRISAFAWHSAGLDPYAPSCIKDRRQPLSYRWKVLERPDSRAADMDGRS